MAELNNPLDLFRIKEATRINVDLIVRHSPQNPARVVLVVGRSGAGKSSLVEHATDETGYSGNGIDPVTTACEVLRSSVNGTQHFFIDTPGFDDNLSALRTFSQIAVLLHTIQDSAVLVGLWYVVDNTKRYTAVDSLTIDWLREFCGQPFLPNVTIVTTHWSTYISLQELERRSEQRMEKFKDLLRCGAAIYKHGRVYQNNLETSDIIPWNDVGRTQLMRQTRDMILRRTRGFTGTRPRIIEEIKSRIEIPNTASGQVLLRDIPNNFSPVITNTATPRSLQQVEGEGPQPDRDESAAPRTDTNGSFWSNWCFKIGLSGITLEYQGGGPRGSLSVTTSEILSGVAATQRRFSDTATTPTSDSVEPATTAQTSSVTPSRWSAITDAIGEAMGPPIWMKGKDLDDPFVQRMLLLDSAAMAAGVSGEYGS